MCCLMAIITVGTAGINQVEAKTPVPEDPVIHNVDSYATGVFSEELTWQLIDGQDAKDFLDQLEGFNGIKVVGSFEKVIALNDIPDATAPDQWNQLFMTTANGEPSNDNIPLLGYRDGDAPHLNWFAQANKEDRQFVGINSYAGSSGMHYLILLANEYDNPALTEDGPSSPYYVVEATLGDGIFKNWRADDASLLHRTDSGAKHTWENTLGNSYVIAYQATDTDKPTLINGEAPSFILHKFMDWEDGDGPYNIFTAAGSALQHRTNSDVHSWANTDRILIGYQATEVDRPLFLDMHTLSSQDHVANTEKGTAYNYNGWRTHEANLHQGYLITADSWKNMLGETFGAGDILLRDQSHLITGKALFSPHNFIEAKDGVRLNDYRLTHDVALNSIDFNDSGVGIHNWDIGDGYNLFAFRTKDRHLATGDVSFSPHVILIGWKDGDGHTKNWNATTQLGDLSLKKASYTVTDGPANSADVAIEQREAHTIFEDDPAQHTIAENNVRVSDSGWTDIGHIVLRQDGSWQFTGQTAGIDVKQIFQHSNSTKITYGDDGQIVLSMFTADWEILAKHATDQLKDSQEVDSAKDLR